MDDDYEPTPRCAHCGDPFLPDQPGQKYCSTRHREASKKRRQRHRERYGDGLEELLAPLGTGVVSVADEADDDQADAGTFDGGYSDDEEDEGQASWNTALLVDQRVRQIRAWYEAKARPLLAIQRRNGGVRLPQLVQLELECEREIDAIVRASDQAAAYERAARDQISGRAQLRAQERQRSRDNLSAFAGDLGRGRRLEAPEPAGRDVWSAFKF
jgi:hypothetical protein